MTRTKRQREKRRVSDYLSRHPPKEKKTEDKPEWCKFHGGGKHNSDECVTAKDDLTVSQGLPRPPIAANKLRHENKIKMRQAKNKARAVKDRSTFRMVSFTL